jgi:TM2 domain-containing membrane protein YozV
MGAAHMDLHWNAYIAKRKDSNERTDMYNIKYCSACGAELAAGSTFCGKCGAPIGASGSYGTGYGSDPYFRYDPRRYPPGYRPKEKLVAGLLGLLIGGLGIHNFYLGFTGLGIAQIAVTVFTCGFGALWGFIEGILYLAGHKNVDANGYPLI